MNYDMGYDFLLWPQFVPMDEVWYFAWRERYDLCFMV